MSARLPLDDHVSSQLFARLFEGPVTAEPRPLVVVNVGPASSETVSFFGQFRCRLFFVDPDWENLSRAVINSEEQPGDDTLDKQFALAFALPSGLAVDLFLFWDSLNQLDERGLAALSRVLAPHVHDHSKGHGYIIHSRKQALPERCFGVVADNLFRKLPTEEQALSYPCTRSRLDSQMTSLTVERSVLHRDGHLEILLRSGAADPQGIRPR